MSISSIASNRRPRTNSCRSARLSRTRIRRGPLWVATIAALLLTLDGTAHATQGSVHQLAQLVIDAIERNYSYIDTAELTLHEVHVDSSVRGPQLVVQPADDGGELRITRFPKTACNVRIKLRGDDLRVERGPLDRNGPPKAQELLVHRAGLWTQYQPGYGAAWIRRHREMPGMFPLDPRQVGSSDVRRSLVDALREDTLSAQLVEEGGGRRIRVDAESASGARASYEFSQRDHFLPTQVVTRWPDGSLLQLVQIEYQDVLAGKAKFLKRLVRRFYPRGRARSTSDAGWREQMTSEVVGQVRLNEQIPDIAFRVQLPPGTRISDNTRLANYVVPIPVEAQSHRTWAYTAAVILVFLVFIIGRRFPSGRWAKVEVP